MQIYLIGFMGSGKSYLGCRLAARLDVPFIDLDDYIVTAQGRSITDIFATEGEAAFRHYEATALRRLAPVPSVVVACGGGTPCFHENMVWMNDHGLTIYLRTPASLLCSRLAMGLSQRPLLQDLSTDQLLDYTQQKLTERAPYYEEAQVIVDQVDDDPTLIDRLYAQLITITGH